MSNHSLTEPTIAKGEAVSGEPPSLRREEVPERASVALTALPAAFAALLIVLAVWLNGAFEVRYWAPPALFVLVVLAVVNGAGVVAARSRPVQVALAALWGLAGWIALSALWSESPAGAWEEANRTVLYAALVSLALTAVLGRREGRLVAAVLVGGVSVVAVITLVRLLAGDEGLFVAGRLDGPVGYRNATALLFAFSVWPLVSVAAARGVRPSLRACCLGGATLALGLALLTQSRGVLIGLALGAIVALGAGPDRVRRAWTALLALAPVAAAYPLLMKPYHAWDGGHGAVQASDITTAAVALSCGVALVGLAGFIAALLDNGLRAAGAGMRRARLWARRGLAVVAIAAVAGGLVAVGNPESFAREKWDEFRTLDDTLGPTRLITAGGQRYDLWRIAWHDFESEPVHGTGAGSYASSYYRERATDRNLNNPHSLLFSLLAETGLVGALLFAVFLGGLGLAAVAAWRDAPEAARRVAGGVAAGGAVVLGQALVDWTWLIPGVTGLGFFALGLGVTLLAPDSSPRAAPSRRLRLARVACLTVAALGVLSLFLSDFEVRKADAEQAPAARLDAARMAGRLNPLSLEARWLQSSALEERGERSAARAKLRSALDLEPRSFVTLALLGDLEVRSGRRGVALGYYRRAWRLNPRDVGLRKLAHGEFGS
jgi:O-antigen ligase